LDYCFEVYSNEYHYSFIENIPLFTAIVKNEFDIATFLINNNADIDYKYEISMEIEEYDIIVYLYERNYLNIENLKFILDHNYSFEEDINDKIILKWICKKKDKINNFSSYWNKTRNMDENENENENENKNIFLEIYIKHFIDTKELTIKIRLL